MFDEVASIVVDETNITWYLSPAFRPAGVISAACAVAANNVSTQTHTLLRKHNLFILNLPPISNRFMKL
jgi:hypothetical protein